MTVTDTLTLDLAALTGAQIVALVKAGLVVIPEMSTAPSTADVSDAMGDKGSEVTYVVIPHDPAVHGADTLKMGHDALVAGGHTAEIDRRAANRIARDKRPIDFDAVQDKASEAAPTLDGKSYRVTRINAQGNKVNGIRAAKTVDMTRRVGEDAKAATLRAFKAQCKAKGETFVAAKYLGSSK